MNPTHNLHNKAGQPLFESAQALSAKPTHNFMRGMNKKFIPSIMIILGAITIGFSVSFAQAPPAMVYVDDDYTVANSDGHSFGVDAFSNIQDGINAVASNGTVNVAEGIYDEQVVIDGKSLTLQGAGDATIIRPSGPGKLTSLYAYPAGAPLWPGIVVSGIVIVRNTGASGATIKDLKVDGMNVTVLPAGAERLTGILYGESAGAIQNVTVNAIKTNGITDRTNGIDAIAIGNPVFLEIINNQITDFLRNGIQAMGGSLTVNIQENTITGLANFSQITNGIALLYGIEGTVSGNIVNRFHTPLDGWSSSGILLYGDGFRSVAIEGNEVFDADYGISISNGANDLTIKENYLHDNKSGVMLESGATNNNVISNDITGNLQGIQIHGGLNPDKTGNKPPGEGNIVSNNTIAGNTVGIISFDDTQTFDAKNNWWGSRDPDFTKRIIGSVVHAPWRVTLGGISSSAPTAPVAKDVEEPTQIEEQEIPLQDKEIGKKKQKQPTEIEEAPKPEGAGPPTESVGKEPPALFDVGVSPGPAPKGYSLLVVGIIAISGLVVMYAAIRGIRWYRRTKRK